MLKQIWRWVSLFPLLHPVWFNLLLLVLAWSLVGVAYQSNDDLVIASVLDGWGDPSYADAHVIFVNPLLTGLLLKVAPVLGGVSVWPVFLALATLSSGAAIFTMLTAHARKARRYDFNTLVLLLVWLLIMPGFYAALQFSHAAFLTGFTGVLACLKYGSSWRGWCAGVFLCVLGSMVRLDAALVCDAFWGAILLAGSLEGLRPSREKLFALSRLWLALACVLISSFSLNEYNKYAHRNVTWRHGTRPAPFSRTRVPSGTRAPTSVKSTACSPTISGWSGCLPIAIWMYSTRIIWKGFCWRGTEVNSGPGRGPVERKPCICFHGIP